MEKKTYNTTKMALLGVDIPSPSRTYKPVSHGNVIDLTLNAIENAGFKVESEAYTSASDGQIATGKYAIKTVGDNEMNLQIAWLNSYNKTKRLTWGIGSIVRICQNGMISADLGAFKKKHWGDIQEYSPKTITEYVKRAADTFKLMQEERERMKQVQIDKTITAHVLGEMFLNEDFITSTQLNIIKREIENPTYDYGADSSMWQLYNFVTYSLKDVHPSLWMNNHMNAHKFFVNQSGIITTNPVEVKEDVVDYHISPNQLTLELQ